MPEFLKSAKLAFTSYLKKNPIERFSSSDSSSSSSNSSYYYIIDPGEYYTDEEYMLADIITMLLLLISISLGFMAVNKICKDTSARGKNTRLGLYVLLILTSGRVGWLYILLWILKINVCE
jgi:hypothetical protein